MVQIWCRVMLYCCIDSGVLAVCLYNTLLQLVWFSVHIIDCVCMFCAVCVVLTSVNATLLIVNSSGAIFMDSNLEECDRVLSQAFFSKDGADVLSAWTHFVSHPLQASEQLCLYMCAM